MQNSRKRTRLLSTSIQLSNEQLDTLYDIKDFDKKGSIAEVIRNAFDFYVEQKYPQFSRKKEEQC